MRRERRYAFRSEREGSMKKKGGVEEGGREIKLRRSKRK
jgi:hypothetical protein